MGRRTRPSELEFAAIVHSEAAEELRAADSWRKSEADQWVRESGLVRSGKEIGGCTRDSDLRRI